MLQKSISGIFKNIIKSFSGHNIFWHLLAIGLTYILVTYGFDWFYFTSTRNELVDRIAMSAGIIGFIVPVILPFCIYFFEKAKEKGKVVAFAVAQAGLDGFIVSVLYKSITGRVGPNIVSLNPTLDVSQVFHFGFLKGGVFWGWPSSHTAVAFAMSFALVSFYSNKNYIVYIAIAYAFFIGIGASIGFHWFSDFVAGAIIGTLIGTIVGENFKKSFSLRV